jgi:hypothetical protein
VASRPSRSGKSWSDLPPGRHHGLILEGRPTPADCIFVPPGAASIRSLASLSLRAISGPTTCQCLVAPAVIGLGYFVTPQFLAVYLYYGAVTALFAAFWFYVAPHPWQRWSVLGTRLSTMTS